MDLGRDGKVLGSVAPDTHNFFLVVMTSSFLAVSGADVLLPCGDDKSAVQNGDRMAEPSS
jgi:hypothetical protein